MARLSGMLQTHNMMCDVLTVVAHQQQQQRVTNNGGSKPGVTTTLYLGISRFWLSYKTMCNISVCGNHLCVRRFCNSECCLAQCSHKAQEACESFNDLLPTILLTPFRSM